MATQSFSIAEARHDLAAVVHQLEHQPRIQLTRRGKPVAVLCRCASMNGLRPARRISGARMPRLRRTSICRTWRSIRNSSLKAATARPAAR